MFISHSICSTVAWLIVLIHRLGKEMYIYILFSFKDMHVHVRTRIVSIKAIRRVFVHTPQCIGHRQPMLTNFPHCYLLEKTFAIWFDQ